MNVFDTNILQASTGSRTIVTKGVTSPKKVRFTVAAKGGDLPAAEQLCHFSYGNFSKIAGDNGDQYYQFAHSVMDGGIARTSKDYCVTHYDLNSGGSYRRISATGVSFGTDPFSGWGTVTINFDRADINYQIFVEVIGD